MREARPVSCGRCEVKFRRQGRRAVAMIERPHLGGPEAAYLPNRRRPRKDKNGIPDLRDFSKMELLLVDDRFSQFDIVIRQYVRDGRTVKEDEEREFYASKFPLTDPEQQAQQHETQMQYLFTYASPNRLAYFLLEPDADQVVELTCPYCDSLKKVNLQIIEQQFNDVLETGGHLVLGTSGLEIRGGGEIIHRPPNRDRRA
jgi:hypothetical protein